MKALLLHPEFSALGFWNYKTVCRLMGAKYPASPLGLITMAALLPVEWELRLLDVNTAPLDDADIVLSYRSARFDDVVANVRHLNPPGRHEPRRRLKPGNGLIHRNHTRLPRGPALWGETLPWILDGCGGLHASALITASITSCSGGKKW